MPSTTARPGPSAGENITHFGAIRLRIVGAGTIRPTLYTLDDVRSATLATRTLAATAEREPTILCNFITQRAALKLETTAINEYFRINRIVIFTKPIWTGYPG